MNSLQPCKPQAAQAMGIHWNLNFIRKCMKINTLIYFSNSKFKFAIKMTRLVFVLCVLLSVRFCLLLEPFGRARDLHLQQEVMQRTVLFK